MPQTAEAPPQGQPEAPPITAQEAAKWLPEALQRPPIYDLLRATAAGRRQLQLIRTRAARDATDSEVAQFLELCAQYMLDWNAHEAWCAVSKPNDPEKRRVLLMVGRDGLRKIAQRNGLDFDGDIVRERDTFIVTRGADRSRTIEHAYAEASEQDAANRQGTVTIEEQQRGKIRGAWCEVYERESGKQRGYFFAPIHEYKPKPGPKLDFSPWGTQESVMILTAAERTALSMATPLGGLVGVGELDAGEQRAEAAGELTAGTAGADDAADVDLPEAVREVIARARELGHHGLSNEQTAAVAIGGQSPTVVSEWIVRAHAELDKIEAEEEPVDGEAEDEPETAGMAEVIDATAEEMRARASTMAPPTEEEQAAADELGVAIVSDDFLGDGPPRKAEPQEISEEEEARRQALRDRANDLLSSAEELRSEGNDRQAEEAEEEAEAIMREVGPARNPDQGDLGI